MSWIFWLVIGGGLIVAEMVTLTFYLLWLGIGALMACLTSLIFPDALLLQVIVGCAAALILTFFTKPLTRKVRNSKGFRDAVDDLVGKQGLVVEEIGVHSMGVVKVGSETWSAKANLPLAVGEQVIVIHRGSAILEVEKWGGM